MQTIPRPAQAGSCRAAQRGQESWKLLFSCLVALVLHAKPNLGHCSNTAGTEGWLKLLDDQTSLSSSPCTAELLLLMPACVVPLVCCWAVTAAFLPTSRSAFPRDAMGAWKAKVAIPKNVSHPCAQMMLYPIFQELLNSAHLLSSVKISRVNFGSGDKSSNTPIVSDEGVCQNLCRPYVDRFASYSRTKIKIDYSHFCKTWRSVCLCFLPGASPSYETDEHLLQVTALWVACKGLSRKHSLLNKGLENMSCYGQLWDGGLSMDI